MRRSATSRSRTYVACPGERVVVDCCDDRGLGTFTPPINGSDNKRKQSTCVLFFYTKMTHIPCLVAVMVGFVRSLHRPAEVFRLFVRQHCQLHAEVLQVQARHFLVELLGKDVDLFLIFTFIAPKRELEI